MSYFLLLLVVVLFVNMSGGSKIIRQYCCVKKGYILIFLSLLMIVGFRSMNVGTDTISYVSEFLGESKGNISGWGKLFTEYSEPLYILLLEFCKSITDNYTIFLTIFGIPITLGFAIYIKRYSDDYMLSTLLFILLGILGFCMAGMRQSISLGLSLFAYQFVKDRKIIPFLLCCIIAFGFHNSSLVFLFIYPISYFKKIDYKWWILIFAAFVIGITKNSVVMRVASIFFTQDRYNIYGSSYTSSLNYTMLIIQVGLLIFCYINKSTVLEDDENNAILYSMAFIGIIFQCFTPILGEFFRLSLFFSASFCILVPKVIYLLEDNRIRVLSYFFISGVSVFYIFFGSSSIARIYVPFWRMVL